MKKLLKVILDCDDVLYQCNSFALEKLNKKYGTNYVKEDILTWGLTGTDLDKRMEFFSNPNFIRDMPLYPGAKEFVRELSNLCEILICTNVASNCAGERVKRIIKDFPEIPAKNIMIGSRKDILHADVSLDDGVHNIANSNVDYPVLFRQPWNRNSTGFISVSKYDEFLSFVRMIRSTSTEIKDPKIFTFVGPSGSGKTTLMKALLEENTKFTRICSYTTRKPRKNEINGYDYHFISTKKFLEMKNNGDFFETSSYMGEYYGSTYKSISDAVNGGFYPVFVLDINGAIAIKQHFSKSVNIFVSRSKEDCIRSILERNIELEEKVKRVSSLDAEMKNEEFCDLTLKNIGDPKEIINPIIKMVFPKKVTVKRLFDKALSWKNEVDFYSDLLNKGYTIEDIRQSMGDEVAQHSKEYMEDHGLL